MTALAATGSQRRGLEASPGLGWLAEGEAPFG